MNRGRQVTLTAIAAVLVIIGTVVVVLTRRSAVPTLEPAPTTSTGSCTSASGCSPAASTTPSQRRNRDKAGDWIGTWAAAMQQGETIYRRQTLRQIVHTSVGGSQVRVRITNLYGAGTLAIGNAHVARDAGKGQISKNTDRVLTFGGAGTAGIPAGGSITSDPVTFAVPANANLAVSLYLPENTGPATQHVFANRTNYVAGGDQSGATRLSGARTSSAYSFLTGVDVLNPAASGAVVTLGASITDGVGSTYGTDGRWPDLLSRRLSGGGRTVGVLNAGISGNELLKDSNGESARKRFDRDVLAQPGVRWVIFSDDPLNDLGGAEPPSAARLIDSMRQLIDRAHAAGIRFYCSTLTPFEGADYWTERGETARNEINAFVRSASSGCDGVLDQDGATHDPDGPARYREDVDSGDHLHPNDRGMQVIADAVDLSLFD
jgi:lysophospholipase L1-like esterase